MGKIIKLIFGLILAYVFVSSLIDGAPTSAQLSLPPRPGYIPVYIRFGDTPLREINPELSAVFKEDQPVQIVNDERDTKEISNENEEKESTNIDPSKSEVVKSIADEDQSQLKESFIKSLRPKRSHQDHDHNKNCHEGHHSSEEEDEHDCDESHSHTTEQKTISKRSIDRHARKHIVPITTTDADKSTSDNFSGSYSDNVEMDSPASKTYHAFGKHGRVQDDDDYDYDEDEDIERQNREKIMKRSIDEQTKKKEDSDSNESQGNNSSEEEPNKGAEHSQVKRQVETSSDPTPTEKNAGQNKSSDEDDSKSSEENTKV